MTTVDPDTFSSVTQRSSRISAAIRVAGLALDADVTRGGTVRVGDEVLIGERHLRAKA
jgi:hypothetical protein